jgi:C-terminal processing protease CtpA/Prc
MCNRLIARLRDGHAALVDLKVTVPDEARGRRFTGPRVHLVIIEDKVFVRQAFGSAQQAGIEIGMEVVAIDDTPIRPWLKRTVARLEDERGYSTDHAALYYACHTGLADWEGSKIKIHLVKEGQKKTIEIVRSGGPNFVPIGPIFPPKELARTGRQFASRTGSGIGYIHLRDVPGNLPEQLDEMLSQIGDAPGLILDMRANGGGGCNHEAVFGRFVATGKKWRQYAGAGPRPFTGPMVVIVDAGVRSAGETVAGMFKEDGRALMTGDTPTAGMSSQKKNYRSQAASSRFIFLWPATRGALMADAGIEGVGVAPHELTPYAPADLARGVDTQIRRAEELLSKGLPKDKVPWEA